jgi:hypothetical protein
VNVIAKGKMTVREKKKKKRPDFWGGCERRVEEQGKETQHNGQHSERSQRKRPHPFFQNRSHRRSKKKKKNYYYYYNLKNQ